MRAWADDAIQRCQLRAKGRMLNKAQSRSISRMRRSRAHSSSGLVRRVETARVESLGPACSRCARTSRRRGSGRGCVGHREGKRDLARRNLGAEPVFLVNDSRADQNI